MPLASPQYVEVLQFVKFTASTPLSSPLVGAAGTTTTRQAVQTLACGKMNMIIR